MATQKQGTELERLQVVNRFFNQQLRYVEDIDLWHEVDYWATPVQALIKGAGDCETTPSPNISACGAWVYPAKNYASPTSRRCGRTGHTWS